MLATVGPVLMVDRGVMTQATMELVWVLHGVVWGMLACAGTVLRGERMRPS